MYIYIYDISSLRVKYKGSYRRIHFSICKLDHIFSQLNQFCIFPGPHSAPNGGTKQTNKQSEHENRTNEFHEA